MGLMAIEGMEIGLRLVLSGFFFCFIGLALQYSNAAERSSITQGERLHDWEYLVSSEGIFTLGFFSPGSSKLRYLGIWNDRRSAYGAGIAWVANRNTPISDSSGALTIDADGGLKITYSGGSPVDLSRPNQTARNVTATLLDSGNFVMSELNSNGSGTRVLWQSFDYPTHAVLPGMKLGLNVKTGHKWSLTSWISEDSPASGAFTLGTDPNGTAQLLFWRPDQVYWKSGLWLNHNSFQFYPSFGHDPFSKDYNFSYVSNDDEKYFTYSFTNHYRRASLVMDTSGEITEGSRDFGPFGKCAFNPRAYNQPQCVGLTLPQCRRVNDRFVRENSFLSLANSPSLYHNEEDPNMTLRECQDKCWTNCSCIAYASVNDNGTGCRLWNGGIEFTKATSSSMYIYKLASFGSADKLASFRSAGKKRRIWFIIAIAGAVVIVLFVASCL